MFMVTPPVPGAVDNDNHRRIPAAFKQAGWETLVGAHEDLYLSRNRLYCGSAPLHDFDLIWPVGFGPRDTYLDRVQLLDTEPALPLIAPAATVTRLHGKAAWLRFAPPTLVSREVQTVMQTVADRGGRWVLKPTGGSYGKDVYLVEDAEAVHQVMSKRPGAYWMLQAYVTEIVDGEMRTLIAGGDILGSYRRVPASGRLTANLATEGRAQRDALSADEQDLVAQVVQMLNTARVGFAAVDTCGGFVMEVNVANPGGLGTLSELYGEDYGARLAASVGSWLTG